MSDSGVGMRACGVLFSLAVTVTSVAAAEEIEPRPDKTANPPEDSAAPVDAPLPETGAAPRSKNDAVPGNECGAPLLETPSDRAAHRIPIALTLNGGVSLGAYEAGYLYYLTEFFKLNPTVFDLQVLTGASAGTLNAFLTLLASGNGRPERLERSLLYRVWTSEKMNYNNLMDIGKVDTLKGALSSRRAVSELADEIEAVWNKGIEKGRTFYIGVSTIKLVPQEIDLKNGYRVTRQEEKFVFSVKGQGEGRPMIIDNFKVLDDALKPPELTFENDGTDFEIIRDLFYASSAFPLVFLPQRLETKGENDDENVVSAYLDGGVMDNYPLRLAYKISNRIHENRLEAAREKRASEHTGDDAFDRCVARLKRCGVHATREAARRCLAGEANDLQLIFVNPSSTSYSNLITAPDKEPQPGRLMEYLGSTINGFVTSARAKEAYSLAEENTDVLKTMMVSERSLPLASGHLLNFMGFFDRNFRIFDFYVGMYDGFRFATRDLHALVERKRRAGEIIPPGRIAFPDGRDPATQKPASAWHPFFCIEGVFEEKPDLMPYCSAAATETIVDGIDMENFDILLQTAMYQLYDECEEAGKYGYRGAHSSDHCKRAMKQEDPPRITPLARGDENPLGKNAWRKRGSETGFDYFIRLLVASRYRFGDLGIAREDAEDVRVRIRDLLSYYLSQYADALDEGELVLEVMGKPLLNRISPPKIIGYLVIGLGAEVAMSLISRTPWLRWNMALQGRGITSVGSTTNKYATFGLAFGPEFDLNYKWRSPFLQFRLILPRVAYQMVAPHMAFTRDQCEQAATNNTRRNYCSGFVVQGGLSVSFYERVRFQIGMELLPRGIGYLGPDKHDWNWFAEIGWQFLPARRGMD